MKPFKFRVWDKLKSSFCNEDENINISMNGSLHICDGYGVCGEFEDERYEISYSTGHFDKNEKEIFSGDIIKTDNSDYPIYNVEYVYDRYKNQEIEIMGFILPYANWEIIGNKYENPELLEKL